MSFDDFTFFERETNPLEQLVGHTAAVHMACFSPDGRYLVSTDNRDIRIWKWNEQKKYAIHCVLDTATMMIAISHDGRFIASLETSRAFHNKVHLWSSDGELMASLLYHGLIHCGRL